MQKVQFEYFYNDDSDQYSFYRIPKLLFTEEYFSSLSCEAKVLVRSYVRPYEPELKEQMV